MRAVLRGWPHLLTEGEEVLLRRGGLRQGKVRADERKRRGVFPHVFAGIGHSGSFRHLCNPAADAPLAKGTRGAYGYGPFRAAMS
jgi:hypothetical protein